ncbi:MAG: cupin domain-containing protein [Fusobacteriaceae bacterium]
MNELELEKLIRKVIEQELRGEKSIKHVDPSGIVVIKAEKIKKIKFDTGNPEDQVYVTDLFSLEESPRIGAGIMEMTKSIFDWKLNYDEIDYIIDGKLEIVIDGRIVVGEKGDVLLIPKGSSIKFKATEYAKFIYVVYPANWMAQK